jgi:hypothetical protein
MRSSGFLKGHDGREKEEERGAPSCGSSSKVAAVAAVAAVARFTVVARFSAICTINLRPGTQPSPMERVAVRVLPMTPCGALRVVAVAVVCQCVFDMDP